MSLVRVTANELPALARMLRQFGTQQVPFAMVAAMTRSAQAARTDLQAAMLTSFDRPTRWTLNSLFVEPATRQKPSAAVFFKDRATGGVPAGRFLRSQILGIPRVLKSHERRAGLDEHDGSGVSGWIMVPGRWAELDGHGNISKGQLNAILAQLSLGSHLAAPGPAKARRRGVRKGESYFMVRPSGNDRFRVGFGLAATRTDETQDLPPGIYLRRNETGRDGGTVSLPLLVIAFVKQRSNSYKVRYDFPRLGQTSVARHLPDQLARALTEFPPRRPRL